ncbi:hypothetical protein [Klebsiella pneumoniae]|uniref:hypothetical protein n=1 Tax=Klebsiella pneumoniae TaxID=573 RepID=UPI000B627B72|nr:hypothetical protein [Klebsiella pneumoniae]OUI19241.1 hypothetical protein AZZ73_002831 [Klebsiella pneumoniae]
MYQDEYFHVTMPTVFAREDATWIKEQLATLPAGMREKIAMAYAQAYQEAFDAEPVSFRQQNAARQTADCESFARGIPQRLGDIRRSHPGFDFLNLGWGKGGGVGF